jgi:cyclic beta-1,2-glucan synthetase
MLTAAGSGFSQWNGLELTRWREDTTRDCWGTFVFLRDTETGELWSAGFQPSGVEADHYDVVYSEDRAKITQRDRSLAITLEVVARPRTTRVPPADGDQRRSRDREIDQCPMRKPCRRAGPTRPTSPLEPFVETEFVPEAETLFATRRPRSEASRSSGSPTWRRSGSGALSAVRVRPRTLSGPRPRIRSPP